MQYLWALLLAAVIVPIAECVKAVQRHQKQPDKLLPARVPSLQAEHMIQAQPAACKNRRRAGKSGFRIYREEFAGVIRILCELLSGAAFIAVEPQILDGGIK